MSQKTFLTEKQLIKEFPAIGALFTIRQDRHFRRGLPYIRFKSKILYDRDDVLAFMEARKITPENETQGGPAL